MPNKLRRILLSWPLLAVAGLFALYVAGGYLALPALVKWQIEKQAPERLGHRISIAQLSFDPFAFRLEAKDVLLTDLEGRSMLGVKGLLADLELRGILDGAWTLAQVAVDTPRLQFDLHKDGRHNFSALLARVLDDEPSDLPRLVIHRFELKDGGIDYSDQLLDEPLVARIGSLSIEVDRLSTLPAQQARYRLSARTAAGETIQTSGEVSLSPIAAKGTLSLGGAKVATLARGLSRVLALQTPAGELSVSAGFDLALGADGALTGVLEDVGLDIASLSFAAPGGSAPLAALETIALKSGRVDLARREVSIAQVRLVNGRLAASTDAQGRLDWSTLAGGRAAPAADKAQPAADQLASKPSAKPATAGAPWRIAVASAEVSAVSLAFSDPAGARSGKVGVFVLSGAPSVEVGSAGAKIEFAKPRLSLETAQFARGPQSLALPAASVEAERISLVAAKDRLELAVDAPRAAAAGGFSVTQADVSLENRSLSLQGERIGLVVTDARFDLTLEAPRIAAPGALSARQGATLLEVTGSDLQAGKVSFGGAGPAFSGTLDEPRIAIAAATSADMKLGQTTFSGKRIAVQAGKDRLDIGADQPLGTLAALHVRRGSDALDLRSLSVGLEKAAIAQAAGRTRMSGSAARASIAGLAARQATDRIDVQAATFESKALSAVTAGSASPAAPAEIRLAGALLGLTSVGIVTRGAYAEVVRLAAGSLGATAVALSVPAGPLDLSAEGLSAKLQDAILRNPADATELLRFASANLAGGALRLRDQSASVDSVVLTNGKAQVRIDAQGKLNWLDLVPAAAKSTPAPAAGKPWRVAVKSAGVDAFAVAVADQREASALTLGLEGVRARVGGLDTGSQAPMQVDLRAKIDSGGTLAATGTVRASDAKADLKVEADKVALAPLQVYLSRFVKLRLADGALSAQGRLRYADPAGANANLAYEGSLLVERLQLDEAQTKLPFFGVKSLATGDLLLTLGPNRVDIGELRVDEPAARLQIATDQTINLTRILNKPQTAPTPAGASDPAGAAGKGAVAPAREDAGDAFPVTLARVRISDGALDFSDASLKPRFAIRMHDLKGVITGLGTDPERSAKVHLDARVDRYGAARIRGQLSAVRPEKFTDIDMGFRNLAMTTLSPYVAKFAGYKVASGRLVLDLKYTVRDAKLVGENKIVLNQLELGDKVESPDALDLPIELALAILKDPDGVIDIGVPVSGDLNDPKFDYAEVIGKAVGNLLGGIVTAPFRALGALFGGGEAKLGAIDFEPGSDSIAPPEHQKLEAVARALRARPTLMLVVPPTYANKEDTPVLKSLAVRRAIVSQMDVKLESDEDPGPIDTANPRVQRAVEAAFAKRYAPEVLSALKARAPAGAGGPAEAVSEKAQAAQPPTPSAGTPSAAAGAQAKPPAGPPPAFYQSLVDRLIEEEPVPEQALLHLATRRGDAIVRELTALGGAAGRVILGKPRQALEAKAGAVTLNLELEVAK